MAATHLLVGAGKMGGALLKGWLEAGLVAPKKLAILDPAPGPQAIYAIERGAKHITRPEDIQKSVKTVLLAIRAMPNTPASIGAGISAIYEAPNVDSKKMAEAEALLKAGGDVVRVESEAALNAVTAISGSGPAYIFHLVEALEAGARDLGLPDDVAKTLARETVIGSAKLLDQSEETPETLRKNVTSPNGTTQAALDVLMGEDGGLSKMMIATARAAFARAKELGS